MLIRYKIFIEYLGTNYNGFQRQDDVLTIQGSLEKAIKQFASQDVIVHGAGRTDKGVHAIAQVAHFDLINKNFLPYNIVQGINFYLRDEAIIITHCEIVNAQFHARFSAKKRHYLYKIVNRSIPLAIEKNLAWQVRSRLDLNKMQEAAQFLIGTYDFTSFRALACQANSPIKLVETITISQIEDNKIHIYVSAPSFLHHMVRNIVGTLKLVGAGKWQPKEVKKVLEAKDRKLAGPTAPACGLYFLKVEY